MVVVFFWIFENILLFKPPRKAATPELHSATGGLAVPPRPIRTAALRRAGERTAVGAPPRRGGSVEIALPRTARLPQPAFSSSLPAFFFSNSTILNFRTAFWPLEPWTRDKRAWVHSKHNDTRTDHSSVQSSPLAVRRISNASAFRSAPGVAGNSKQLQIPPSSRAL